MITVSNLGMQFGTDDAIAVAGQKLQVYFLEQPLSTKLHSQVTYCNHIDSYYSLYFHFNYFLFPPTRKKCDRHIIIHGNYSTKYWIIKKLFHLQGLLFQEIAI